jgi:hypothetical protein
MKSLLRLCFLLFLFVAVKSNVYAQSEQGNAVIITNYERAFPENASMAEFDSLTHEYNVKVWDKNPFVVSHKTVRHWWGNNSRDMIEITEVKTWDDIPKAMAKNDELFRAAWPTKEARASFDKAYNKYFTGKHSDEIYQAVK